MIDDIAPQDRRPPARAEAAMIAAAIRSGADWGYAAYLTVADALRPDAGEAMHAWAIEIAGTATLALIEDTEQMADALRLDPQRRRRLIEDRVGACRARLMEMTLAANDAPGARDALSA